LRRGARLRRADRAGGRRPLALARPSRRRRSRGLLRARVGLMSGPLASGEVGLQWAGPARHRGPAPSLERLPAWSITAVLGLAYLITAPPSADLAAASYRSDLFGRLGLTVWDNGWY